MKLHTVSTNDPLEMLIYCACLFYMEFLTLQLLVDVNKYKCNLGCEIALMHLLGR